MPFQRYGKMRRDTAGQLDFGVYDFSGGLDIKSAPQEVADNCLTQALNGYLRMDGGFESRRGMNLYQTLPSRAPVIGLFRFAQNVVAGKNVQVRETLAQCGGILYNLDSKAVLGTLSAKGNDAPWSITIASDPQANPRQLTNESGITDVVVICTGEAESGVFGSPHGPFIYDGYRLYHPQGWDNAKGARWCQLINGVVWFGGIKGFPTQVMSTGSGQVAGDSFEKIAGYSIFDFGQPVVGMSSVGSGAQAMLCVGLPNGLSLIYGTGPANYTQQNVPMDNDGVACGNSMQSVNGIQYLLGNNNAYQFTPSTSLTSQSLTPLSTKVQPWITDDPFVTGYPMQGSRQNFFAFTYYDRYHIAYSSANANVLDTVLVYDTNIQGWTVLSLGEPITCSTLINAPGDPSPSACLVGGTFGRVYTWDPYVGQDNTLWNVAAWDGALWDDTTANNDNGATIQAWVATKFFKVGEPGTVKTLHRLYPEIIYPVSFGGTATVQTDYAQESVFTAAVYATQQSGSLWDVSVWDNAFWQSTPVARSMTNAPASRIDVFSLLPNNSGNFLVWNLGSWNQAPWGSTPLPSIQAPGIQAEAFSFGMQSGIGTGGAVWDLSTWDNSLWSVADQLPWVLSGFTGSFSQGGRR